QLSVGHAGMVQRGEQRGVLLDRKRVLFPSLKRVIVSDKQRPRLAEQGIQADIVRRPLGADERLNKSALRPFMRHSGFARLEVFAHDHYHFRWIGYVLLLLLLRYSYD